VSDLVAFLRARLDEDEREIRNDPPAGMGYAVLARRMVREVQAKRAILDHYADLTRATYPRELYRPGDGKPTVAWGLVKYGDYALRQLAAIYSDHPDYDQEWRP
jgi:uncharacterized protein DUF6221